MRKYFTILTVVFMITVFTISSSWATQFPYRDEYPSVPVIELEELKKHYDNGDVVIVDVRSDIEYKVIHPRDAIHIDISNRNFLSQLKELANNNPDKKIVCYCNGVTCLKSYEAAKKANEAGLSNVYAFDAGIPAWARTYPKETLLLGKRINNPEKQLISEKKFQERCLDFASFQKKAKASDAVVIDARSTIQRTNDLPGLEGQKVLPMPCDKFINNIIKNDRMKDKTLLIYDQVGKQVEWLMYYLVDRGYTDYYFLSGGANAVLEEQEYR